MSTTLFCGGPVRTAIAAPESVEWVAVDGAMIRATGTGEPPSADRVIDLGGATLIPAFCDAHVHLPATGLQARGLDFRGERNAAAILDAFRRRAAEPGGILYGANFEDPFDRDLNRHDLDRAVGDRAALLARADLHSCIVSSALLSQLRLGGVTGADRDDAGEPTGYLREQASAEAWAWFDRSLSPSQQRDAVLAAIELAYSKGISRVHEMFVVEWRGWDSLEVFAGAIADVALDVSPYVATMDVSRLVETGLPRIGGDLFLDGSFGSHTAWMLEPYRSTPPSGSTPSGIAYRGDDELVDFFSEAHGAGLQVGVHAIGDAAIEQALAAWEKVAERTGIDEVAARRHRIEHFECATDDHIARAARLGIGASIQPAFDRYWGGEDGLYAQRIGWERASDMNRFASMLRAGLVVGAGSDSTVTPLDPFIQMAALRTHHVPEQRLDASSALRLHTFGGQALAGGVSPATRGTIEAGKVASLAVVDRDPLETDPDELTKTEVLATWIDGCRVWPRAEAEVA